MKKKNLVRFINKYFLGGHVSGVALDGKKGELKTRFITSSKNLIGEVLLKNWELDIGKLGVYDTEQLLKLIQVLTDDDINVEVNKSGDKSVSLRIYDSTITVNYILADLSVIADPPAMKRIPEFELESKLSKKFVNNFISGKTALPDVATFAVLTTDDKATISIGHSSINTNRVIIPLETTKHINVDDVYFNANLFKEILAANRECETGTLWVSSEGLAKAVFLTSDIESTYYLVASDGGS